MGAVCGDVVTDGKLPRWAPDVRDTPTDSALASDAASIVTLEDNSALGRIGFERVWKKWTTSKMELSIFQTLGETCWNRHGQIGFERV